jgi:hypothetical protein
LKRIFDLKGIFGSHSNYVFRFDGTSLAVSERVLPLPINLLFCCFQNNFETEPVQITSPVAPALYTN